jgi:hypothetical protein
MQNLAKLTALICLSTIQQIQSYSCDSNLPKINEIRFTHTVLQQFKSKHSILSEEYSKDVTFEDHFRASIPRTIQQVKKCTSCEKKAGLKGFTERMFLTRLVCTEYSAAKRSDFVSDVSILKNLLLADFGRNRMVNRKSAKFARGMIQLAGQCLNNLAESSGCKRNLN